MNDDERRGWWIGFASGICTTAIIVVLFFELVIGPPFTP